MAGANVMNNLYAFKDIEERTVLYSRRDESVERAKKNIAIYEELIAAGRGGASTRVLKEMAEERGLSTPNGFWR